MGTAAGRKSKTFITRNRLASNLKLCKKIHIGIGRKSHWIKSPRRENCAPNANEGPEPILARQRSQGCARPSISRLIGGRFRRDSKSLAQICDFLDIKLSDFLSDPQVPDQARIKTLTIRLLQSESTDKAKTIIRLLEELSQL